MPTERAGRIGSIAIVLAGLAVHTALALHGLEMLPAELRLTLAFAVHVMLPGFAFVRLGARPPGGPVLAPAWAFGLGFAWNALLVFVWSLLGRHFTELAGGSLIPNGLLWAGAWMRPATPGADDLRLGKFAAACVLAAALVASWHSMQLGPPMSIVTDSPDHVGTLRRMIERGDAFPRDAFYQDAGPEGADPRKGLWHAEVALLATLAGVDPLVAWRGLSALVVPWAVLQAASLGWLLRGGLGAGIAAWAFVLTYGASFAWTSLRQAVFSTRVADQLALATVVAAIALLRSGGNRGRLAVVGLAFGAVAAHVFAAIHLTVALGALALAILLRDRRPGPDLRRVIQIALAAGLACAPYLLWRARETGGGSGNPIHTEVQGMMMIGRWSVVSPGVLWDWYGLAWIAIPIGAVWLARRRDLDLAPRWLLVIIAATALVIFNPLLMTPLAPRLGYLFMRFVWMVPLSGVLAWLLPELITHLRSARARTRALAWGSLAAVGVTLVAPTADAVSILVDPHLAVVAERYESYRRWSDALAAMEQKLPHDSVVLSDPATSYTIPMVTGLYVVTLVDQHSSPRDTRAVERLLDARDALDPWSDWDRMRGVVKKYGVDAIALNNRFTEPPRLQFWGPQPEWFRALRARLDRHPAAFEPVFDSSDFVVYRVHEAALDTLSGPAPARPNVRPWVRGRSPVVKRVGDHLPALAMLRLPKVAAPGDTLRGVAEWRALESLPPASYRVVLRFDRELPDGIHPPDFLRKPVRKLLERIRGVKYRLRADHLPLEGAYGVDRWSPSEIVLDSFTVVLPPDAAEGRYQVRAMMVREPHYANVHLGDYFFDEDLYSGVPAGSLELTRDRKPAPVRNGEASDVRH